MAGGTNADLKERVTRLEDLVGPPQSADAVALSVQLELLYQRFEEMRVAQEQLQKTESDHFNRVKNKVVDVLATVSTWTDKMGEILSSLETDVSLLKKALQNASLSSSSESTQKAKVPDPKPFTGSRNAKELENFLWDMGHYFKAVRTPDAEKVDLTSMYLTGDAKLWWRTRSEDKSRP